MSCFDVKILEADINTIEIETCIGDQPSTIEIVTYDNISTIEINSCVALLPSEINDLITVKDILAGSGISVSDTSGVYTVSLSNPTIYSSGIIDFLESVQDVIGQSGLIAGNYININYNDTSGLTTISTSGLQPSGNYSVVGHTHTSNDITNFSSSVSGLLPVKNVLAGSGIGISSVSGDFTVSVTGTFGLTGEEVDDRLSNLLVSGNYVNLNYNDLGNSLTISVTGVQPSGNYSLVGHSHNSSDITNFDSAVSGLLPSVNGSGYIVSSFANNVYTLSASGLQPSGNYSIVGHSHVIADVSGLQNSLDSKQPSGVYASGIHYHTSSDITNFNSSVSGLLPNVTGVGQASSTFINNIYTISVTGLQPSGNYSVVGHTHVTNDITNFASGVSGIIDSSLNTSLVAGTGINLIFDSNLNTLTIATTGLQPSGNYSVVGHTHTTSNITDFNSGVSGLLPTISGSGYVNSVFANNIYTISVIGVQPSGNYSVVGHTHTSSNITDFNTSVSGLLPVKNIIAGSGIGVSSISGNYTVSVTGTFGLTSEEVDDRVSNLLVAGTGISLNYDDNSNILTISTSGTNYEEIIEYLNSSNFPVSGNIDLLYIATDVSRLYKWTGYEYVELGPSQTYLQNHTHTASQITDFNSGVSGLLPVKNILAGSGIEISSSSGDFTVSVTGSFGLTSEEVDDRVNNLLIAGTGISLVYDDNLNTLTVSTTGLQPSGNYSFVGHSHIIDDVSGLQSALDNKQPSGVYASGIHTHTASEITDFSTSVSGLLPVKNIVGGSGINVSSLSGIYTVAVTGIAGLISEEVDDRVSQLLVEGTGVNLTYNDVSGTLTIDNLHTEINILSQEPQGFVNRTDSVVSFNDSTRTFTIQPAVSGGFYNIYVEGIKVVKSGIETVVVGSGTALNYIHFDTTPPYVLQTKTTGFDFDNDVPIAFIHWNSDINQSTFFGEERHGIRMDSVTHKWIHNTFGMQYISGLSIGGYTLLGDGSSNSHAQIDISDGILYQEDIIVNITNGSGTAEFVQPLSPIAYIPTYYHSGSTGQWVRDIATEFPVKYNGTSAQYNLFSGGTWTTPNVTNGRYFAMWIVATNDINDPILAIVGQRQDSSLSSAESNNTWSDINLNNIPTQEIRPLYRLIFRTNNSYTNTPKSSLQSILDIRVAIQSTALGVVQNDHGSLFGLADDDHSQYVHIDNNRTISALHTFSNGLNASGLINAASGNFTSLTVNNTGVVASSGGSSGYLSKFTSSNAINNSIIYQSGNNIGINTTNPSYQLDVSGSIRTFRSDANEFLYYERSGTGNGGLAISAGATTFRSTLPYRFFVGANETVRIDSSGNVGIGTTTPSGQLHVVGTGIVSSRLGIGTNSPYFPLHVSGNAFIDGNLVFDSFTESVITIGNSSTSQTLSLASGTVQTCTLTGNCTFTMPTATAGKSFTMFLNSGSGNYTASFSGVLWSDSAPPTITTTASKVDILSFISDGSYWYGSYSQNYG